MSDNTSLRDLYSAYLKGENMGNLGSMLDIIAKEANAVLDLDNCRGLTVTANMSAAQNRREFEDHAVTAINSIIGDMTTAQRLVEAALAAKNRPNEIS